MAISIILEDGTFVHFVVEGGRLRLINSQPENASEVRNHDKDARAAEATAYALARHNGWL